MDIKKSTHTDSEISGEGNTGKKKLQGKKKKKKAGLVAQSFKQLFQGIHAHL